MTGGHFRDAGPTFWEKGCRYAAIAAILGVASFTINKPTSLEVDATRKNCGRFLWGIFYGLRRGNRNFGASGHQSGV
jgi:hypothetical protein